MRYTIYISGPMTGLPELNYPTFNRAAAIFRQAGMDVRNPADIKLPPDADWTDYMRQAVKMLLECEAIAMLPGWQDSRGAKIEKQLAEDLGMQILQGIDP